MRSAHRGVALAAAAAAGALAAAAAVGGLQRAERHFGCPPTKNVCVYPIDTAVLQCEALFDFQVELHVVANASVADPVLDELRIRLRLPSGEVTTPAALFPGATPEFRRWALRAFRDMSDENPTGYDAYAVTYRNVFVPMRVGEGHVTVTVEARGVTTEVAYQVRAPTARVAKNVVLFVGDGMSLSMMTAARLVSRGMYQGKYKDKLTMQAYVGGYGARSRARRGGGGGGGGRSVAGEGSDTGRPPRPPARGGVWLVSGSLIADYTCCVAAAAAAPTPFSSLFLVLHHPQDEQHCPHEHLGGGLNHHG